VDYWHKYQDTLYANTGVALEQSTRKQNELSSHKQVRSLHQAEQKCIKKNDGEATSIWITWTKKKKKKTH